MRKQRSRMSRWLHGATLATAVIGTAVATALLTPTAAASPETDAYDAITAAWEAAGGNESRLGGPQGDVYPVGAGFAGDFTGGKIFFTPETGAHPMYGPILDKYESLGGPAGSDLGFPDMDQTDGAAVPDSQFISFSATDNPLIYFTPEHGAFVVRGPINAAWDALGSSAGALGAPSSDESFDGDVITQSFAAGQLSWNRKTHAYTTAPPELADQLADVTFEVNPTDAINATWRALGAGAGPLGARAGDPEPIGPDGTVQAFAGGKIYYTPGTGANAVEGDVLAKYESLGGPAGSDLGFPTANPAEGGLGADSQISAFSAPDHPVIFWSSEHGAFVVRGAIKAAWDKLGGAAGDLGAPVGDQTIDGDLVEQKFADGVISWNQAENSFTTEPGNLAASLAGLQVPGLGAASAPTSGGADHAISWHWWWLPVSIGVLLLAGLLAWLARWRHQRDEITQPASRRPSARAAAAAPVALDDEPWAPEPDHADQFDPIGDDDDEAPPFGESFFDLTEPVSTTEPEDTELPTRVAWAHRAGAEEHAPVVSHDPGDYFAPDFDHRIHHGDDEDLEMLDGENPDDVDTAPTPLPGVTAVSTGRHSAVDPAEQGRPSEDYIPSPYPDGGVDDPRDHPAAQPAVHLPLSDPYQAPEGFPIKANTVSGLYYTPDNPLYHDTLAEVWFATETIAQANGFLKAE
ncbi:LGFP repeat-containing protein [Mycolicibacillus koreensis]|nr:hypothetical protein [Mycolicibacillus koreensis]